MNISNINLFIYSISTDFLPTNFALFSITLVSDPTYNATHITYLQFRSVQPRNSMFYI